MTGPLAPFLTQERKQGGVILEHSRILALPALTGRRYVANLSVAIHHVYLWECSVGHSCF